VHAGANLPDPAKTELKKMNEEISTLENAFRTKLLAATKEVLENGVFYAANQLYGLTFSERKDIPVYHPDVRVFEVMDAGGKPLALFYCDYFKRDNKNGGAWMSNLVEQSRLLGTLPVVYNVANFSKPAAGQPALISFTDATTMFHEFGHALHGMFADSEYPSLSGTSVARDFVEFPSQFNEHWATYPAIFDHYARHYETDAHSSSGTRRIGPSMAANKEKPEKTGPETQRRLEMTCSAYWMRRTIPAE
jgi:Zn-dependent oligopeptidase